MSCLSYVVSSYLLSIILLFECIALLSGTPPLLLQLWNTFHRPELLRKNMNTCLKDLGLDYVDHVQLHYSFAMVPVQDEK